MNFDVRKINFDFENLTDLQGFNSLIERFIRL